MDEKIKSGKLPSQKLISILKALQFMKSQYICIPEIIPSEQNQNLRYWLNKVFQNNSFEVTFISALKIKTLVVFIKKSN